jgi:DNA-directed RNA polymerase specialized sigma24 family protein
LRYGADFLAKSPESVLVGLARSGNRDAFAELVNRRQAWIRNLMRRCCRDAALADDLAQQAFMQAWQSIRQLHDADRFAAWLKRLAINVWLQHKRRNDPLRYSERMTHDEIAEFTGIPLGTVKSHIRRGTHRLQQELAAYLDSPEELT